MGILSSKNRHILHKISHILRLIFMPLHLSFAKRIYFIKKHLQFLKSYTIMGKSIKAIALVRAGVLELADEVDSKSIDGDIVRVQVPPPAPNIRVGYLTDPYIFL